MKAEIPGGERKVKREYVDAGSCISMSRRPANLS